MVRPCYGGLGAKDIHARKNLKKSQKILDHMGSAELAAKLFRVTQAEKKLRRDKVRGKTQAKRTHHEAGSKVRKKPGRNRGLHLKKRAYLIIGRRCPFPRPPEQKKPAANPRSGKIG